jgi:chromosome partitioning protein
MSASKPPAQVIVVGNEKGGAGKSTLVIHLATALMWSGARVAVIDLDLRQQSLARFFANRRTWLAANNAEAPVAYEYKLGEDSAYFATAAPEEGLARFDAAFAEARAECDYVIIDTPGGHTPLSQAAHARAQLIVTPMNDSFVDFDLLGTVDPVTLELLKPSIYSETVWEARKRRMMAEGRVSIDWVVLRNRLAPTEAKNRKRVEDGLTALAKRVGFRIGPGLRDRVIYRELFPFGLTVADLGPKIRPVQVSMTHVAARQELRSLMHALKLDTGAPEALAAE